MRDRKVVVASTVNSFRNAANLIENGMRGIRELGALLPDEAKQVLDGWCGHLRALATEIEGKR